MVFQRKKIQEVELEIEHEIESLKTDRRQLEFHIERTEVWSEHVGKWLTHIYNAEVRIANIFVIHLFFLIR